MELPRKFRKEDMEIFGKMTDKQRRDTLYNI